MPEFPTGTVTFLFTDIEGSTALLHELGEKTYSATLLDHRARLRAAFGRHGGVEVDTQGDSFFVAFADPLGAVAAAAAAQESLAGGRTSVRMGIHTGRPHVSAEGYVGPDVHLGARIAAAAHGGQVVISRATRELVGERHSLIDLGEHRLKDFGETVWLYQLGDGQFPPLRTISNTNLPRPASSFVGRERETADIRRLLTGDARLVTLTGPGGSGKTRLAQESAAAIVEAFANGVFWVDLSPLSDARLVGDSIGGVLGTRGDLAEHISERQMLLVLDNFERVVEAAPEISRLLAACRRLRMLVTSRELLRIRGEVEYPVLPLAASEAAQLFADRTGLDADAAVAELCARLDNLPLGVELAAARAKVLSPAQILQRLGGRADLLQGGRDADPRQRTLRATIDWSYELLNDDERRLFRRLSVFRGGWRLEAAEAICEGDLDVLQQLVQKSLVAHAAERFAMLETIREFAAERLDQAGDGASIRQRHAQFFVGLASDQREAVPPGPNEPTLEAELDNIRAALSWCLAAEDRTLGLLALRSLWYFWLVRGHVAEGHRWAEQLLAIAGPQNPEEWRSLTVTGELARFAGSPRRAVELKMRTLDLLPGPKGNHYASTARDLALTLVGLGEVELARRYAEEALELRTRLGEDGGTAHALFGVAQVEWASGRREVAIDLMEQSATLTPASEPGQRAWSLEQLADFERRTGHIDLARRHLGEAVLLADSAGDHLGVLWCLRGFGNLMADEGDTVRAITIWAATDALARAAGMTFEEAPSDYDEKLAKVRQSVGDADFQRLWTEGAEMSLSQAQQAVLAGSDA